MSKITYRLGNPGEPWGTLAFSRVPLSLPLVNSLKGERENPKKGFYRKNYLFCDLAKNRQKKTFISREGKKCHFGFPTFPWAALARIYRGEIMFKRHIWGCLLGNGAGEGKKARVPQGSPGFPNRVICIKNRPKTGNILDKAKKLGFPNPKSLLDQKLQKFLSQTGDK